MKSEYLLKHRLIATQPCHSAVIESSSKGDARTKHISFDGLRRIDRSYTINPPTISRLTNTLLFISSVIAFFGILPRAYAGHSDKDVPRSFDLECVGSERTFVKPDSEWFGAYSIDLDTMTWCVRQACTDRPSCNRQSQREALLHNICKPQKITASNSDYIFLVRDAPPLDVPGRATDITYNTKTEDFEFDNYMPRFIIKAKCKVMPYIPMPSVKQ